MQKEWGVETEGKDIYDLAHEMSDLAQEEYGKIRGVSRWLKRAPQHTQDLWHAAGIEPRAIGPVRFPVHFSRAHKGNTSKPEVGSVRRR